MLFSNEISRVFGELGHLRLPKSLQSAINRAYVRYFGIDMSEFRHPDDYESLVALFTRALQKPRTLQDAFISPCDSLVFAQGASFGDGEQLAFSIKDRTYSVNELLQGVCEADELSKGVDYANLYLSPRDYHRYHAPCDMQILASAYTKGRLYSVSAKALQKVANLYTKNERVALRCKCGESVFWLVFVGATNVGKMRFHFDKEIQTNAKNTQNFTHNYTQNFVKKGDELGYFELGSTIVIIAQKGFLKFTAKQGDKVKFGDKIAEFVSYVKLN